MAFIIAHVMIIALASCQALAGRINLHTRANDIVPGFGCLPFGCGKSDVVAPVDVGPPGPYRVLITNMNTRIKAKDPKMLPLSQLTDTGRGVVAKKLQQAIATEGKSDAAICGITQDPVIINGVVVPGMAAIVKAHSGVATVNFYDYEHIKAWHSEKQSHSGRALHPEFSDVKFKLGDIILLRDYLPGDEGLPGQRPVVKINPPSEQGSDIEDWMNGINY